MNTQNKPRGAMPRWLAGILVLIVIAGGIYVGRKMYRSMGGHGLYTVVMDDPQKAQLEGPRKTAEGAIHGNRNQVYFGATPRDGSYIVSVYHAPALRQQWAKGDHEDVQRLSLRIVGNNRLAEHVGLTPEQRKALAALPSYYSPPPTDEERQKVAELVKAWDSATGEAKSAARDALLNAVAAVGAAHLEEAKANWVKRVTEVPAILKPEQLKLARTWDPNKAPRTAPAKQTAPPPAPAKATPAVAPAPPPTTAPAGTAIVTPPATPPVPPAP